MPKCGIPDRWEYYNRVGKVIDKTRFIAFKVPLKESLCRKLSEKERFTPSDLISSVDKLGMVIDLTNTYRYYNSAEITNYGITYTKILCQGRIVPDKVVVNKFFEAVEDFLKNKNGLIGVHCTHGVNRTGYLICKYMIDRLEYQADDAIRLFNEARGHDIERKEYINHLQSSTSDQDKSVCSELYGKNTKEYKNSNESNDRGVKQYRKNRENYIQKRTYYRRNYQENGMREYFQNSQQRYYRKDNSKWHNGYFYQQPYNNNQYNYTINSKENSWYSMTRFRSFDSSRTRYSNHQNLDYHQSSDNFETRRQYKTRAFK